MNAPVHAPARYTHGDAFFIGHADGQDVYFTVHKSTDHMATGYMLAGPTGPHTWYCAAAAVSEDSEVGRIMRRHAWRVAFGSDLDHPPHHFETSIWIRNVLEDTVRAWRRAA